MEWIGFVVAVASTVVGLLFRKQANVARSVAEMLVLGIERGRNTGDSRTPDSVKQTVKFLVEKLPPSANDYLDGMLRKLFGG